MHSEIVICECYSIDHQFVISYDDGEVFLHVHLVKKSFWKRLSYAVRYLLGRKSRYGAFDEIIIGPKDKDKFLKIYEHLETNSKKEYNEHERI